MAERTFSIIKPDAVRKGFTGAILAEIERAGFQIAAIKRQSISVEQARGFYAVHAGKPFFETSSTLWPPGRLFSWCWRRRTPSPICAS